MSLLQDKIEVSVAEAELNAQQALSTFPRPIRWLLILGILAIIPVYFISKSWAQSYWLARYDADRIAAKASFAQAKPPTVSAVTLIPVSSDSYTAIVSIKNENVDLSLAATQFKFNFYDAHKELVASLTDKF